MHTEFVTLQIGLEICTALNELHNMGVINRLKQPFKLLLFAHVSIFVFVSYFGWDGTLI
jgi:hypothetical protein